MNRPPVYVLLPEPYSVAMPATGFHFEFNVK